MSSDLAKLFDQRLEKLFEWEPLKARYQHHPAKFSEHRHRGIGDIMRYNGLSCDLARRREDKLIKISYHPAKFGGHRHSGTGDMIYLFIKEGFSNICQIMAAQKKMENTLHIQTTRA